MLKRSKFYCILILGKEKKKKMEIANSGEQKQQKLPVVIAITGSLDVQQSEIARQLAKSLHYPVIDERDINQMIPELENPIPTPPTTITSDLPFKIATQISSTLLLLKFPVIINSSISGTHHLDHLLHLATSKGALVIIIDCFPHHTNPLHDYCRAKRVPYFSISLETLVVEKFVSKILEAVHHQNLEDGGEENKSEVADSSQDSMMIPIHSRLTEAHAHEFCFTEEPKIGSGELHCNRCQGFTCGPTYQCVECDEFILHKSCAEISTDLEAISKFYPLDINQNPSKYNFPETYKCKVCERYSSDCNNCLLQTHIRCGVLPTICRIEGHEHPLSFVIMPIWFGYEYKCHDCGRYGKFIGYKCYGCCLDLHIRCAISRAKILFPKIIGGERTESALQDASAFRREMIMKAIGAGYVGHKQD